MNRWMLLLALLVTSACVAKQESQESATDCLGRPVSAAPTGTARLNWDPPKTRIDGSPIDDLSGYKIYYGIAADQLRCEIEIADPKAVTWKVTELSPGTWYFAVVSVDSAKVESELSGVVSKRID